jgi:hypothetical protein
VTAGQMLQVRPADVGAMLNKLGMRVSKREADEIMWEADEDRVGGALDVQDCVNLYFRVTGDATGYEPRRLCAIPAALHCIGAAVSQLQLCVATPCRCVD